MENNSHHYQHESKTMLVVYITVFTIVVEIIFGYSQTMALLTDRLYMAPHVLVLGLLWIAYHFARKHSENKNFKSSTEKLLALSGYKSTFILLLIAIIMVFQSAQRLIHPLEIKFSQAILVAIIGLVVNLISTAALHHKNGHNDPNIKSGYLHLITYEFTSVTAIIALTAGMYWSNYSLVAISEI